MQAGLAGRIDPRRSAAGRKEARDGNDSDPKSPRTNRAGRC